MKKIIIAISILIALAVSFGGAAYALSIFAKEIAGYGQIKFTSEVTVTDSSLDGASKVKIKLQSNVNTVADKVYNVRLILNGELVSTQTVSWTAPQIPGNTKVKIFSDLDLSTVTIWDIEVRD